MRPRVPAVPVSIRLYLQSESNHSDDGDLTLQLSRNYSSFDTIWLVPKRPSGSILGTMTNRVSLRMVPNSSSMPGLPQLVVVFVSTRTVLLSKLSAGYNFEERSAIPICGGSDRSTSPARRKAPRPSLMLASTHCVSKHKLFIRGAILL
jgi:hypothetical protein